ncbi:MAG: S24 family peptidase [Halarcobacter sp.]
MEEITLEYIDIFDENKTKEIRFSKGEIKEPFKESSLFVNIIDGKSMEPLISDKAVIVSDISNKVLIDGGIYLVYYENKMWVKKYNEKKEVFFSINSLFSHLVYGKKDVHIVGKVVLTFNP